MTRRDFGRTVIGAAAGAAAGLGLAASAEQASGERGRDDRPNILFILTDDQRGDNLGCTGSRLIGTPDLDALARSGVVFENNFCTTSICCASRASILTGMYSSRHGIERFDVPLEEGLFRQTYPALLRDAGYRTGFVGKWGLGGELPADEFDVWAGFAGQGRYFGDGGAHLTSRIAGEAVRFIESCSSEEPFCLSVSFKAPHEQDGDEWPFQFDSRFAGMLDDATIPPPPASSDDDFQALPSFVRSSENRARWEKFFGTPERYQKSIKDIYRLLAGLDDAVARMVAALKKADLYENTVIVYSSDNGAFHGEHQLAGKWLMYEESIRTPLFVHWARLPAWSRGRRISEMSLNIDLAPTILDFAGVSIPDGVQGRSLKRLMTGEREWWRTDWFYEHHYGHGGRIPVVEGVRSRLWKYGRYPEAEPLHEQLFNLREDPHEQRNLAGEKTHREVLERFRARWAELRASAV